MKKHDRKLIEDNPDLSGMTGLKVMVRTNRKGESDINTALRNLKRKMNREGIPRELKRHEFYESKGQIRRRRKAEAIRRQKKMLKEFDPFASNN